MASSNYSQIIDGNDNNSSKEACREWLKIKNILCLLFCIIVFVGFPLMSTAYMGKLADGKSPTIFDETARNADILIMITYIFTIFGIGIIMACFAGKHGKPDTTERSPLLLENNRPNRTEDLEQTNEGDSLDAVTENGSDNSNKYIKICIAFIFILGCGDALFNLTRFGDQLIWVGRISSQVHSDFIQSIFQLIVIWRIPENANDLSPEDINTWIILSFAIWLFDTFSAKEYATNKIQVASH
ncbi:unnamed protein product, partial [Rotaria sordida]